MARHGKFSPSGSSSTAVRPFALIVTPVAPSTSTRVGIPRTPYSLLSFPLRLSPGGMASHGIVAKYDLNWLMFLSPEMKTISSFLPAACSFLYVLTRIGVKYLHGGHLQVAGERWVRACDGERGAGKKARAGTLTSGLRSRGR